MNFLRREGYAVSINKEGQMNFQKRVSGNQYPRFHIYVTVRENQRFLNLHLDQKRPSYLPGKAHMGEYDSDIVQNEGERLKKSIENLL